MEIRELKDNELKIVNMMYEKFIEKNPKWGDSLDYVVKKLERCQYCGELFEIDNLQKVWSTQDQQEYVCCNGCKQIIDSDNLVNTQNGVLL